MFSTRQLKHGHTRAFSLTELAIAIATVSVSLVALLGLVSITLKTGQSSASETSLTSGSRQVLDALRARNFSDLPYLEPERTGTATEASTLPVVYLADDGQWLAPDRSKWPEKNTETARPLEAVYQCVVQLEPDSNTLTPVALSSTATRVNLLRVQLSLGLVKPPADSTPAPAVLIHASIPRQ